jgi:two-component system cell cycle sensor histidine kinase/response regulator CckA
LESAVDTSVSFPPAQSPDASGAGAGKVVLVVEDEEAVRTMLHRLLENEGYEVLEASDGQQAPAVIEGAPRVDLVKTDVAMPAMNGRQFADRLKLSRPGLPVLFMSGYTDDEMATRVDRDGPSLPGEAV